MNTDQSSLYTYWLNWSSLSVSLSLSLSLSLYLCLILSLNLSLSQSLFLSLNLSNTLSISHTIFLSLSISLFPSLPSGFFFIVQRVFFRTPLLDLSTWEHTLARRRVCPTWKGKSSLFCLISTFIIFLSCDFFLSPIYLTLYCFSLPVDIMKSFLRLRQIFLLPIDLSTTKYLFSSISLLTTFHPNHLSIHLSIHLPTYLSIHLSIYLFIYLSIYLSTCLSTCLSFSCNPSSSLFYFLSSLLT